MPSPRHALPLRPPHAAPHRSPLLLLLLLLAGAPAPARSHQLSAERVVLQTKFGDMELALYPHVAPQTAEHMLLLAKLGALTTNNFFRVDKGFVAQTQDVRYGRSAPLDPRQRMEADKTLPLETRSDVKHDRRGLLSMARSEDPHSGTSSFSVMLGPAPHLDGQYTIFGELTRGLEVLSSFEALETRREGIFVMPKERIEIVSSYVYTPAIDPGTTAALSCEQEVAQLRLLMSEQTKAIEKMRKTLLP